MSILTAGLEVPMKMTARFVVNGKKRGRRVRLKPGDVLNVVIENKKP